MHPAEVLLLDSLASPSLQSQAPLSTNPLLSDAEAELARWEKLIFQFEMDQNSNSNSNNNSPGQSPEDIQTAALLTQLAAASNLFNLNASPPPHLDTAYAAAQGPAMFNAAGQPQYISPTTLGPPPPGYHYPAYNPLASPQIQSYSPRTPTTQSPTLSAGPSSAGAGSSPVAEDDDYEDKRRRNTEASARFRIKKKLRTLELERSVSDLSGRAEELEREAADLRRENGWLKEIVMLKGGHLSGIDLLGGFGIRRDEENKSGSESEDEQKDKKGKGKAKQK
ncbi:Cytochrome C oxidase assembly protein COX19 [Mycena kentingensis (nom. inval.)]|nr:Cytochrome C oxidase assembly protein COX19 [Mycena kentingensis (nom. inval.)]